MNPVDAAIVCQGFQDAGIRKAALDFRGPLMKDNLFFVFRGNGHCMRISIDS